MPYFLAAAVALLLASFAANRSTERAHPRLHPALGWPLTFALLAVAVVAFSQHWGVAVAIAVAVTGLMVGIPAVSSWIGWHQRKDKPARKPQGHTQHTPAAGGARHGA